jgi:hypothetical protein
MFDGMKMEEGTPFAEQLKTLLCPYQINTKIWPAASHTAFISQVMVIGSHIYCPNVSCSANVLDRFEKNEHAFDTAYELRIEVSQSDCGLDVRGFIPGKAKNF